MDSVGVGLAELADTIITAALIYSLHRSRTGFESTDTLIDTLIMYTINTGLLTDVFNMASFICAIVMPDNLIYAGIVIVSSKLYANTVMTVLNSRKSLASKRNVAINSYSVSALTQASSDTTLDNSIPVRVSTVATSEPAAEYGISGSGTGIDDVKSAV
ncbi:hypothetical protein L227DRAFT_578531 [Lentinus tigrinus ALCF2SS1-6]|uniref:DUF6534 domain-containing protein n=1 Tax=Lentinus tigrinus ALCF2SS1-6 TaxID=1328759 RepID=A0A5C2S0I7_9APHY|nr:hypothetical protein L227DRAFT_578531 [Lentinus tigrinus ALCF2SS1-6]